MSSPVSDPQWQAERRRTRVIALVGSSLGFLLVPLIGVLALWLTDLTSSGDARYGAIVAWMAVLFTPGTAVIVGMSLRQQAKSDRVIAALAEESAEAARAARQSAAQREQQSTRQAFESRLNNALQMAEDEGEVLGVIEQAVANVLPSSPVELLLADNSHAHLLRVAKASPTDAVPGCRVPAPDHCPASRRARTHHFGNSQDLDACPKLRARGGDPVAAVCVPVSIMGRSVGVLHAIDENDATFGPDQISGLKTIANLAGSRIGLLRAMASSQLQAATDSLTGLLNRRAFESELASLRGDEPLVAVAMADLDHFKLLNDTYGHETGDRALRLFSDVVRGSFRARDLLCRHGGEEFVVAFPACTAQNAAKAIDNMRARLDAAITVAGLPRFTVSVGVVDMGEDENLPAAVSRADVALFAAKAAGRDRVIVHDATGNQAAAAGTELTANPAAAPS